MNTCTRWALRRDVANSAARMRIVPAINTPLTITSHVPEATVEAASVAHGTIPANPATA